MYFTNVLQRKVNQTKFILFFAEQLYYWRNNFAEKRNQSVSHF